MNRYILNQGIIDQGTADHRPATAYDTVVFDLGGVLIDWNPRHLYRKLFDEEAAMEQFLGEICTQDWNERQDAGHSFGEAVAELSAEYPQHAALIAAYHTRWDEMLGGPLPASVAVFEALRARGLRLYALTNWSHETFPIALQHYAFLHAFEGIVVSGHERLIKPDPTIFRRLLSRYGIAAERAVYIDDSPRNVAAAGNLGMHALHFRDAAELRGQLTELGLLDARAPAAPHG